MRCERCKIDIMKADNFCRNCAAPNPRNEWAGEKLKKAVIGAVEAMGIDVQDAEGINGESAWKEFQSVMWAPDESGSDAASASADDLNP